MKNQSYQLSKTIVVVIFALVIVTIPSYGQNNVGIGTTTPNSFSMLDISSSNKGLLIPRVTLASTTSNAPVGAFVAGMMVYNTATVGDVTPGFYLCNGLKWEKAGGGGVVDSDGDTKIEANNLGGNDEINVTLDNVSKMKLKRNANGDAMVEPFNTSGATFYGEDAGKLNTGLYNTMIGSYAGSLGILSGGGNTGIGYGSVLKNSTGYSNTGIGYTSLYENTSGVENTAIGALSLYLNTTGSKNIAIGSKSLYRNISKSELVAIGDSSLFFNGVGAVFAEDATFNTAVGSKAMRDNTVGFYSTAVGYKALMKNTTGRFNTAVGHGAMQNLTTHSSANSAFGQGALFNQTGGDGGNTGIGAGALNGVTTGGYNTGLGYRAGFANQGEKNIFIGSEAGYYSTGSNKLFIENSNVDSTNALIYGNFATDNIKLNAFTQIHKSTDGTPLLYAKNTNTIANAYNYAAIKGENNVQDWYGIGVEGIGGWVGISGKVNGTGNNIYYGTTGNAEGNNTGANYGLFGYAANGAKNYGVYGFAPIGTNDFAGYFEGAVAIGDNTPKKATG